MKSFSLDVQNKVIIYKDNYAEYANLNAIFESEKVARE